MRSKPNNPKPFIANGLSAWAHQGFSISLTILHGLNPLVALVHNRITPTLDTIVNIQPSTVSNIKLLLCLVKRISNDATFLSACVSFF